MAGTLFIILSTISLFVWINSPESCSLCAAAEISIGFFNRPWLLWGSMYYALVGVLVYKYKKNWLIGTIMFSASIFHVGLIYYGQMVTQDFCVLCLAFTGGEIVAMMLYLASGKSTSTSGEQIAAWGPGKAVLIIAIITLAINPLFHEKEVDQQRLAFAQEKIENVGVSQVQEPPMEMRIEQGAQKIEEKEEGERGFGAKIMVRTPLGNEVEIDIAKKPTLFFSWWCLHCDQALKDAAQYTAEDRPYLVVVYLKGNDKEFIEQKLKINGLAEAEYYLYPEQPPVKVVPSLVWWDDNKLNKITGYSMSENANKMLGKARIEIFNDNSGKNAILALKAINGVVIPPGGVFSFNQTVGERTYERGYTVSGVVIGDGNGGYEFGQGIGGGICRTATVLHWAVKKSGLEVIEHSRHSLPVKYGKANEDAAVSWPYMDYKFRNNTQGKLTVKTVMGVGWIELELWK